MQVIRLSAKAGPDGRLHLEIPADAGAEYEVAVVTTRKDVPRTLTPEERGWPPGYFESVVGSIQDETFVAPTRSPARPKEVLG